MQNRKLFMQLILGRFHGLAIVLMMAIAATGSTAFAWGPTFGSTAPNVAKDAHGAHASHETSSAAEADTNIGSTADLRDRIIGRFVTARVGTVPVHAYTGSIRTFDLDIREIETEISPGVVVKQWAYGRVGQTASVPGPELRVTEGDLVRITLHNTHHQPHTLHLHGITSLAMQMDGVPHTSHQVLPGDSYTYEFVATEPGTHAYHCHVQTFLHMDMGMYGALIVEPRLEGSDDANPWSLDVTLVLDEWDSRQDPEALVHVSEPDHFLVNGVAYPNISPVRIDEGQVARLRFINMGYEPHSFHLHGMSFLVIAKDGYDLAVPYQGDTLPILPGERYDILIQGRDGDFPFHDHIVSNNTNRGVYPGGMHFMVLGGPARDAYGEPTESGHAHGADAGGHGDSHGDGHGNGHDHGKSHHADDSAANAEDLPLHEGSVTVRIVDFAFDAPVIRVRAGTVVTWVNETRASHTITHGFPGSLPEDREFDSSGQATGRITLLRQGQSWSHTFDRAGEFAYYCLPHTSMTGKVIVE